MQIVSSESDQRVFFFDNLRYFFVLLVVALHSVISYTYVGSWWVVDDKHVVFFDHILIFLDIFLMPGLFFIAGYFALISHEGKTTWGFIKNKLKRLGIPWAIGVVLLNPFQLYIYNVSRGDQTLNLAQCFLYKMKSALSFHTGMIESHEQFNQFHFWFISLLLLFFIVFALGRMIKNKMLSKPTVFVQSESSSTVVILGILFSAGMLTFVLNMAISIRFPSAVEPTAWIIIGNVIQFQASRVVLFIICFGLGICAYRKNWFSNNKVPGHLLVWVTLSIASWYYLSDLIFSLLEEFSRTKGMLYLLLSPFFFFSILLMLISFGIKYWNLSSKINRTFADSSYSIYLIHMVIIWFFQWAMLAWFETSIYVKAIGVCGLSILASLLVCHYLLNKSPRMSVTGLLGAFAVLLMVLR